MIRNSTICFLEISLFLWEKRYSVQSFQKLLKQTKSRGIFLENRYGHEIFQSRMKSYSFSSSTHWHLQKYVLRKYFLILKFVRDDVFFIYDNSPHVDNFYLVAKAKLREIQQIAQICLGWISTSWYLYTQKTSINYPKFWWIY